MSALDVFSPATRAWFENAFGAPTPAQRLGWPAIASGPRTLTPAPRGARETRAACLSGSERLSAERGESLRRLSASPLKALNYAIERRLRGPLARLESSLRVA